MRGSLSGRERPWVQWRWSLAIFGVALHACFYVSAFHPSQFLKLLFPTGQLHHGYVGLDLFAVPAAAWDFFNDKGTLAGGLARPDSWTRGAPHNPNVYHPLFTLVVGGALQLMPSAAAALTWQIAKGALWVATVGWLTWRERRNPWAPAAAFVLLAWIPRYHDIKIGQYQGLLDTFLLVFLLLLPGPGVADRTRAGLCYVLSLLVKPVGVLFAPVLALRGRFVWGLVCGALFLALTVPFHFFPWSDYYLDHLLDRGSALPGTGPEMYSLASLLVVEFGAELATLQTLKLVWLLVVLACCLRPRVPTLSLLLAMIVWFLAFDRLVYEYHFSVLAPFAAVGLLREPTFRDPVAIALIALCAGPSIFVVYNLLDWNAPGGDLLRPGWSFVAASRIVPAILLSGWLLVLPQVDGTVMARAFSFLFKMEAFRFGLVSVVALALDLAVLVALKELAGVPTLGAAACGFFCGAVLHYALSIRYVSRFRRLASRLAEATTVIGLSAIGLALLESAMWVGTAAFSAHYLVAKLFATVVVFAFNFGLKKLLLFSPSRRGEPHMPRYPE